MYSETRAGLTARVLDLLDESAADQPASPLRLTVHAWLAYVEDLAIEWSGLPENDRPSSAEELVEHSLGALTALRAVN